MRARADEFSYDSSMVESSVRSAETKLAIEVENVPERGDRRGLDDVLARGHAIPRFQERGRLDGVRTRGKPRTVFPLLTGQGLPSTSASPRHATPTICGDSERRLGPIPLEAGNDGSGRGSRGQIGRENGVLEVESHARKCVRGVVHKLEQLRAGLLLGGIDVLIPLRRC